MSRAQRLGLIGLAVAVAAVAFVLAKPDDEGDTPARPAAREPAKEPTATIESRPEERIRLLAHKPFGGVRPIEAKKGDLVRLVVESDAPDEIHLHGYDITRKIGPSEPGRFSFRADIEGVFDLEGHGAGGDEPIARLAVRP